MSVRVQKSHRQARWRCGAVHRFVIGELAGAGYGSGRRGGGRYGRDAFRSGAEAGGEGLAQRADVRRRDPASVMMMML